MTFVQIPPNSTGEKLDVVQLPDGIGNNVDRQVAIIGDDTNYAMHAKVQSSDPSSGDSGLTVRSVRGVPALPLYIAPYLPTTSAMSRQPINASTTGNNTLVTGVSGQTIRIWGMLIVFSAATTITIKDGTSTAITGAMPLLADGDIYLQKQCEDPYFVTSASNAFVISQSGSASMTGVLWYTQS